MFGIYENQKKTKSQEADNFQFLGTPMEFDRGAKPNGHLRGLLKPRQMQSRRRLELKFSIEKDSMCDNFASGKKVCFPHLHRSVATERILK